MMSDFNIGDRVELISDIEHYYQSRIGIVTSAGQHAVARLKEFVVRLADGMESTFSGFQLRITPPRTARSLYDSAVSVSATGMRGSFGERHLLFADDDVEIHLKVAPVKEHKKVLGEVITHGGVREPALVTLLVQNKPYETTTTDDCGEFMLQEVPPGDVSIEVLVPSRRVVAAFDA